jgi:hypothetical protein
MTAFIGFLMGIGLLILTGFQLFRLLTEDDPKEVPRKITLFFIALSMSAGSIGWFLHRLMQEMP